MKDEEYTTVLPALIVCTAFVLVVFIIAWALTKYNIEDNKEARENPLNYCAQKCGYNGRPYESCLKECSEVLFGGQNPTIHCWE